jgi:prepilin-type N-terminal cleavage/methylation domain-containing protein
VVTRRVVRAGFTLPEALIALTISSVLVLLVGTVFLVQNDFYSHVFLRSQVHENSRAMAELVASEARSMTSGGFIVADSTRVAFHQPMVIAVICGRQGSDVIAHLPGGIAGIDTAAVAGFGVRSASTLWSFYNRTWSQLKRNGGNPPLECYSNGADTTGISSEFVRLRYIDNDTGFTAAQLFGYSIMITRRTEFRFAASSLVPGDRALYWGIYGQTLRELVTGVSGNAHFEFRTAAGWQKVVTGAALANIIGIRVVAETVGRGDTSAQRSYDFGISVDIPLPNTL